VRYERVGLTEGLGHTSFMGCSLRTGLRAQVVGTRAAKAFFGHGGKDYLCDEILNVRPLPQSAQLRHGLKWEALMYQSGCYE